MAAVEAIFVRKSRPCSEVSNDVIRKLILVLAGGFVGTIVRFLLSKPLLALATALPGAHADFPYDILLINLSGAFVIGLLFGAFEHGAPISSDARLFLGTGFLGAYTTFSSFMVGTASLLRHGQSVVAILYLAGAMAAGVTLAMAGFILSGVLITRSRAVRFAASEQLLLDGGWEDATHLTGSAISSMIDDERLLEEEEHAS